jgi:CheY-like chemotaxis protein
VSDSILADRDNKLMQRTVLIVEDADTCASTLEIVFSALGVEVVVASNGEQAWRVIQHADSNLAAVVTDLEMRGMDGYELIERIRGQSAHEHVPIMVITGTSDPDAQDRVRRLGANAFFTKPFSPALVRDQLEQWLNHATT